MADYTTDLKGEPIKRSGGANAPGFPAFTVWTNTFDCAEDRTLAISDTISEFLEIPANTYVLGVFLEVHTGEASVTLDVGDASDPNGYVAAQSCATAGVFEGAGAYVVGATDATALQAKFYNAATDISIAIAGAAGTVLKFTVKVVGVCIG